MSPVGSVNLANSAFSPGRIDAPLPKLPSLPTMPGTTAPTGGFGQMLDGLVATVSDKQATSAALTKQVLMGDSGQLHQSVIAMQEASVAFGLMVEVRNKLVESYQEMMRMQV